MARPRKERCISPLLNERIFKPRGIPLSQLPIAVLSLDELEALRLADLEGNQHDAAAARMNVSRPTFGRILAKGRRTVATALLLGHALQIAGGPVRTTRHDAVRCRGCHRAWEIPAHVAVEFRCPRCAQKTRQLKGKD